MYQAIVFLPLLGCIVAGLIALAGARARHPGADPLPGTEDHAIDHGPHTGGGAPSPHGDHAVIHESHHEEHPHQPPAAGSRAAELVTTLFLFVAMVLSWIALYRVGFAHQDSREVLFAWMYSGDLKVDWGIRVDTLTAVMLMLVTADNLVQLFFGWEGVGLASYLLIGFWYQRPSANAAAIKAFVVNRVGDFGFALGIFGIFALFGSVNFDTIFANAGAVAGAADPVLTIFGYTLNGQGAIT